jgi:hypothetical protein
MLSGRANAKYVLCCTPAEDYVTCTVACGEWSVTGVSSAALLRSGMPEWPQVAAAALTVRRVGR